MEYAIADVRYLAAIYTKLRRDLIARGRIDWAETEFRRAETKATETAPAGELYFKFNLSGLSRRQLAILRELAATRDTLARSIDKPPSFIIPDPVLLQMAKHPPADANSLRSTRGMPGLSAVHTREVLAALQRVEEMTPEQYPERNYQERPDPQIENVAALLGIVTQLRAGQHDISRTYLAPRDQVMALAAWWLRRDGTPAPALPLLSDWRRELVGAELLQLLDGRLAIALDATPEQPAIKVLRPVVNA
jgi:ribonuclease D